MGNTIKILQINSCNFGSTGNIMLNISEKANEKGYVSYVAYANSRSNKLKEVKNSIVIGTRLERNIHLQLSYFTGYNGCFSIVGTRKLLKQMENTKPDIIHLHNLHNCYINLRLLFNYIKERDIPVIWTLHDCWAFTGQCPHYTIAKCDKWKSGCYDCPQYRQYPASRVDKTKEMYKHKKYWFTGVKNLTLVTPSEWLKNQVEKSYLSEYPVKVINTGIDLSIFKPSESNFRDSHNIHDKILLLGVANPWSTKKGLDVFIELSKILNDTYKIVLVGLTDEQIKFLPEKILGLPKTNNQKQLAELYTAADIFLNPTFEDTFPTTNLESMACGTPIITFNTGGGVEVINKYTGRIVEDNTMRGIQREIDLLMEEGKNTYLNERLENAKKYINLNKYEEYIDLYMSL